MLTAKDIMNTRLVTLGPDDTLRKAVSAFSKNKISGAPVVGPHKRLLGVISQSDLVRRVDQRAKGEEPAFYYEGDRIKLTQDAPKMIDTPVREVMTRITLVVDPEMPIDQVARLMLGKKIHRVLVAEDGALRGVISSLDLIRGLLDALP